MNFEEKLKKQLTKKLDKDVPNPYAKKGFFSLPLWTRITIPVASIALTGSVVVAILVPSVLKNNITPIKNDTELKEGLVVACAPKLTSIANLNDDFVSRTASKTLRNLDSYFADIRNKNCVLSPASYLLSVSSVAAVSDDFSLSAFGIEDACEDTKLFLKSLNCSASSNDVTYSEFSAGVLHQQVGSEYGFSEEKRIEVSGYYISTGVANKDNYSEQARDYFEKEVGVPVPIPNAPINKDAVLTYSVVAMSDQCSKFETEYSHFYIGENEINVPSAVIGTQENPKNTLLYKGENYTIFSIKAYSTEMVIVLPNEGVSLEKIPVSEAYQKYLNDSVATQIYGHLPYFQLSSNDVDLSSAIAKKMTGNEKLYSKLLSNWHGLKHSELRCYQSSLFEFDRNGIDAKFDVTFADSNPEIPQNLEQIEVDRPFYMINLRNNFPLFVCKVNNPIG